jgi:CheY-like chemotaxis protein
MRNASDSDGPSAPASVEVPARRRQREQPLTPNVLLIEDEPGIVDFVRRGLEAEGFAVEAALDGAEGERLALRGGYDAIVLDLMLPGRRLSQRRRDAESVQG